MTHKLNYNEKYKIEKKKKNELLYIFPFFPRIIKNIITKMKKKLPRPGATHQSDPKYTAFD